jgi:deoxyadenosine/deoxycytidine kinase
MVSSLQRLAELVRLYREALRLSQKELARRVRPRTNRSAVAHLEQALRLPSSPVLRGLCTYLGIPEPIWAPFETMGFRADVSSRALSFVAVSGVMGSGKTTLGKRLAAAMGLTYLSESSLGLAFLSDLGRNTDRWAFDTQLAFLCQKATAIHGALTRGARILVDRSIHEDVRIFAKHFADTGSIDARSFAVYENLARHFLEQLPAPDAVVYCRCSTPTAFRRIVERGRADVPLHDEAHVREIGARYQRWIESYSESTVFSVDSEAVDFRDPRVVQTIAGEIERSFAEPTEVHEQLDFFSQAPRPPTSSTSLPPGVVEVLFRGARVTQNRITTVTPVLPYPTAYVAAPFTSKAGFTRSARRTLFPVGQKEGQIARGRYRSALLEITKSLATMGVKSILPHRDVNRWGRKSLTSEEVMRACTAHVASSDLFVGLLGKSHGAHYEFGVARGLGKPALVIHCRELDESFVATGVSPATDIFLLKCDRLSGIAELLRSAEVRSFLQRNLLGFG